MKGPNERDVNLLVYMYIYIPILLQQRILPQFNTAKAIGNEDITRFAPFPLLGSWT